MKKLLALLLALCVTMSTSVAEEDILTAVQPLVNVTATAVMLTGEKISPDKPMSNTLVQTILQAGLRQEMGYTAFDMQNIAWCDQYLGMAYAVPFGLTDQVAELETYAYYGVRPMVLDESEDGSAVRILGDIYQADDCLDHLTQEQYAQVKWLDQRAVVELRRHPEQPDKWQLTSFSLDAEWEMEQAAQDYFTSTMVEYVHAEWGMSIQYPAVFGEDSVTAGEHGISGKIPEASFGVMRTANDQNWTAESLLAHIRQETSGAETNINDITGCISVTRAEGDVICKTFLLVTQAYVYQAELTYHQSVAKDFALYADYMMHSFTLDEMGVG